MTVPVSPDFDVVVVGFGPVGSVMAALLARRGISVLAVDRDVDLFALPRAAHFDQEMMRVLQELDCAHLVGPATIVNPGMDFLNADGKVLLSMRPDGPTPSGWPASVLFFQPDLELVLRDAANRAGAAVRLGCAVDAVHDHGDHVAVQFADGTTTTAAYVVACDGARSTVRKQLGITMHDLQFEEPWLVLDLVLDDPADRPSALTLQVCDPARPTTLVPMPAPRFRFEFMQLPGEDPEALAHPDQVRTMLSAWMDPDRARVERAAVYTFHGLIADEWRRGRVLLAGDAAHQMPPFLGQGMCSGVRDAANLAWKLRRVLDGSSPDALLDTYQVERGPQVQQIIQLAVDFGRIICTTDHAVAAERDAGMLAARDAGGGRAGAAAMPPLATGALIAAGGGAQLRQVEIDGQRLDDLIGDRIAIIVRDPTLLHAPTAQRWITAGAVAFDAVTAPALTETLDAAAADVVVVRPDRYVLFAGAEVPEPSSDATTLLAV
jgi:3-(3-hydroxy-phenyl)propionate hydroxylase